MRRHFQVDEPDDDEETERNTYLPFHKPSNKSPTNIIQELSKLKKQIKKSHLQTEKNYQQSANSNIETINKRIKQIQNERLCKLKVMKPSNYKSEEKHPFELMEAMSRQQKEFDLRKEEIVDKRVHLLEKMQRKNEKHDFLSKK